MRIKDKKEKMLPFKRAMIWIVFSTLIISGTAILGTLYYFHICEMQSCDDRYVIVSILQTGDDKGKLSDEYLAERLGLSVDRPKNLHLYNLEEARQNLCNSPVVKRAEVKKKLPASLSVQYTLREPVAVLGDLSNTALDAEGYLFPIEPFNGTLQLPKIYMGDLKDIEWGDQLHFERTQQAISLLGKIFTSQNPKSILLKHIDMTKAESPSHGQREVVIVLDDQLFNWILRLSPENIEQQLANFSVLRDSLLQGVAFDQDIPELKVVDLRIPDLAFVN